MQNSTFEKGLSLRFLVVLGMAISAAPTSDAKTSADGTGPQFVSLALGAESSCGLLSDGQVACWGANHRGQLGDGGFDHRWRPGTVPGLTDVVQLACGSTHCCAVLSSGRVRCWGGNSSAQVGNGITQEALVPQEVLDLTGALEVATGMQQSCARLRSGEVMCWGRTHHLTSAGPRMGTFYDHKLHIPGKVPGLQGAVQIGVGGMFACALVADGRVLCWGNNHYGTLGDGTTKDSGQPVAVDGLVDAIALGVGMDHACALRKTGRVLCWGNQEKGQRGDPGAGIAPSQVKEVTDAVQLSVGWERSCVRRREGGVLCWGKLPGDRGGRRDRTAQAVKDTADAVEVVAGRGWNPHLCIRRATGELACMGHNNLGQLGDGSDQNRLGLVAVLPVVNVPAPKAKASPAGKAFRAQSVSAASDRTCALAGSGVYCWGNHSDRPPVRGIPRGSLHPKKVAGVAGATQLSAGGYHACALLKKGRVKCWGENGDGQLGNGKESDYAAPARVVSLGRKLPKAVEVQSSFRQSCARLADGGVACWGDNRSGRLGAGRSEYTLAVPAKVKGVSDAVELALGDGHACVRRSNGRVLCWGQNSDGQLGMGEGGCRPDPKASPCPPRSRCKRPNICDLSTEPVEVKGLTDALEITAGGAHTCARRRKGTVVCWGSGHQGELGDGAGVDQFEPVKVRGLERVVEISAGSSYTCARRVDGRVLCWGQNVFGQLGDRTDATRKTPVLVWGLEDASAISAGHDHTCASRKSGEIVCWGNNSGGKLGDGTEQRRHVPGSVRRARR